MIEIRNFNNKDVDFIYNHWAENSNWGGCKFDKDKFEIISQINEFNLKKFNNKYFEQFVIVYNNNLVGIISLLEQNEKEVSVNIFINQEYRRRAIATNAYKLIEVVAKEKGYSFLSASVSEENHISINMHIKFGFQNLNGNKGEYGERQIKFIKKL